MLIASGFILLGLVLLVGGGELLVRGATGLALLARITPTVVGLTVVAAGTSMPELVVSVQAGLQDRPALAVGNVVGSNIFNIAAILGLAALLAPLRVQGNTVRLEWPVMLLAALQLHLLARDGSIDRLEGGFLLVGMTVFVTYTVWIARKNTTAVEQQEFEDAAVEPLGHTGTKAWLLSLAAVAVGVGLLVGGASALVHGASDVARALGVAEVIIGLTIVAAGTSLPELAASAVAAYRGNDDIAIANVIGSNIFNVLGIVGVAALVRPLDVPAEILTRDNWWMIGVSLLLFPLMRSRMRINRIEGSVLLTVFITYMAVLVRSA